VYQSQANSASLAKTYDLLDRFGSIPGDWADGGGGSLLPYAIGWHEAVLPRKG